jgi:AAA family ATP:ADP antiporter
MVTAESTGRERSSLERLLGAFTEVRGGEGGSALLLTLNVFLLLTSYYIIKPVRDALILSMPRGAEYKSYMGAAIAAALLLAVPAYASFAKKLPRNRLVVGATLFFVSHIVLFALGTQVEGSSSWLPLVFYLWVGIFNMMVVAQFWAFANDIYDEEQGKRLFALIGIGASAGAAVGGALAKWLPRRPEAALEGGCGATIREVGYLSTFQLLVLSAAILALCALLTQIVHQRETRRLAALHEAPAEAKKAEQAPAPSRGGAFRLVLRHRYLLLLAIFSLVFTLVNSNGEYMLGKLVKGWVADTMARCAVADEASAKALRDGLFTSWYGDFYFYVNVAGVLIQSFLVSRLVKLGGLRLAFFVLPAIAFCGAAAVLAFPLLAVLRPAKIAENATDYSVNNTVRNMLWLPTTRQMKYQAKQAVDTFFVRLGDVSSGALVFLLAELLSLSSVRYFAGINLALIVLWLWIAAAILREQEKLKKMRASGELGDEGA